MLSGLVKHMIGRISSVIFKLLSSPEAAPPCRLQPADRGDCGEATLGFREPEPSMTPRPGQNASHRRSRREGGFSLIEQIVAVGLVAVVVPSLALLLSSLVRQASAADAEVAMLVLARSQVESVKQQPYQTLPGSYTLISPIPSEYSVNVTVALVKTYAYPFPDAGATLPDQIQLITVQVDCLHCSPPVGSLILQEYKVRR